MIELGTVSDVTAPIMESAVTRHLMDQGAIAVFIDGERNVLVLAHHAPYFEEIVQRGAAELVGVYVADPVRQNGLRHRVEILADIRARLDELQGQLAVAA